MQDIPADPLEPAYAFGAPGQPVEVHQGSGLVDGEACDSRIFIPMRRDVHLRWTMKTSDILRPGSATLVTELKGLGAVEIPLSVEHSAGRGSVREVSLGGDTELDHVIVHWVNLPSILPASGLAANDCTWSGRWTVDAGEWRLTLDSRRDLPQVLAAMNATDDEEFVMTHVGQVERVDGQPFDVDSGCEVLYAWQVAMSFAMGRWVAPALPVGFGRDGRRVWEQWAPWRCDEMRGYESWWDTHTGDDLASFVAAYLDAYLNSPDRATVRLFAHHVIAANHSGTTGEAKIMLTHAALEYLAWVDLVLSARMSKRSYKKVEADEALRTLLRDAGIPLAVPADLPAVAALAATEGFDGPRAATWVRNRLVHPKDPDEPYRLEGLVWQASRLAREYAELLLLRRVGYVGRFKRHYPPGRWSHDNETVPWAASSEPGT